MYNFEVFNNCNKAIIQALKVLIDNWKLDDKEELIDFFKYLKNTKVPLRTDDKQEENSITSDLMNSILLKLELKEEDIMKNENS